jgi:hypothetical protein
MAGERDAALAGVDGGRAVGAHARDLAEAPA